MIKLITIDVDGTLVTPLKRLTQKNKEAIFRAKEAGVHIALASGRPYSGMKPLVKELGLKEEGNFSVVQNGAYIFDNKTDDVISGTFQNPKDLMIIDELVRDYDVQISAMDHKSFYSRYEKPNWYTKVDAKISKLPLTTMAYEDFPHDKTFGRILILGKSSQVSRIWENMPTDLRENYYAVKTAPNLIEVMNKRPTRVMPYLSWPKTLASAKMRSCQLAMSATIFLC